MAEEQTLIFTSSKNRLFFSPLYVTPCPIKKTQMHNEMPHIYLGALSTLILTVFDVCAFPDRLLQTDCRCPRTTQDTCL